MSHRNQPNGPFEQALEELKNDTRKEVEELANIIALKAPMPVERKVEILMYFDEAHVLTNTSSTNTESGKTLYNVFLSVLNDYVHKPFFVLFLSTTSHISRLAPTRVQAMSSRAASSGVLQAPITETPFDCKPEIMVTQNTHSLDQVRSLRFLARFGRPL